MQVHITTDLDFCDAPGDANICGATTDLAGVYVANPVTDCDIFETCEAPDPICSAVSCPFEVVDDAICQIDIPPEVTLIPNAQQVLI